MGAMRSRNGSRTWTADAAADGDQAMGWGLLHEPGKLARTSTGRHQTTSDFLRGFRLELLEAGVQNKSLQGIRSNALEGRSFKNA